MAVNYKSKKCSQVKPLRSITKLIVPQLIRKAISKVKEETDKESILQMATVMGSQASSTTPVVQSAPPFMLYPGPAMVIFSTLLNATMFIDKEGELRVNPRCGRHRSIESVRLHCSTLNGPDQRCNIVSRHGRHLLAVRRDSGMLSTVSILDHNRGLGVKLCTEFQFSTRSGSGFGKAMKLSGCMPVSNNWVVRMSSSPATPDRDECYRDVGPFYQSAIRSNAADQSDYSFQVRTLGELDVHTCSSSFQPTPSCRNSLRKSYPLMWDRE
eukprot:scpid87894/ scgid9153/ 